MSAGLVLLVAALTLALMVVGIWQVSKAGDRRRDLAYVVSQRRESALTALRGRIERRVMRTRRGRRLRYLLDRGDLGWKVADVVLVLSLIHI